MPIHTDRLSATCRRSRCTGFTLVEVLVSSLLICIGLGSILAINTKTVHTLRAARQAAVASQVLQQRVEALRERPWPQLASSDALAQAMATPTESECELAGGKVDEVLSVSSITPTATGPTMGVDLFRVRRKDGVVTVEQAGDLNKEASVLIMSTVTWKDPSGAHTRNLRTIICRAGLTRSGIFGSALGRPATDPVAP
jgi:prepilin-type N-terminal cleavage/methylation domain-containing protein